MTQVLSLVSLNILTAEFYIALVEDFESLAADRQDRCVVVIKVSSLM
ncbi:MAG: hypothetical protein ACFB14_07010 [Leptolyngbyaceae cyanobacterium]